MLADHKVKAEELQFSLSGIGVVSNEKPPETPQIGYQTVPGHEYLVGYAAQFSFASNGF